ncbi:hypothetical protein OPIT5_04735 [Opitutaceae bacterium TAV5]|nr:hypothetical protein OPIT5_04735 [Opitutaceae bacterium TAV5]
MLAALPANLFPVHRGIREVFSLLGLAGILIPVWLYSKDVPFPGFLAVPPCLGATAFIWSNTCPPGRNLQPTLPGKLLSLRPMVFVGLISYSLYLWHWPLVVLQQYGAPSISHLSVLARSGLVAVAAWIAVISWLYIETPFRKRQIAKTQKGIFLVAGAAIASIVLASGFSMKANGLRLSEAAKLVRLNEIASEDRNRLPDTTDDDIVAGRLHRFGTVGSGNPVRLLAWGDSHAKHTIAALDFFCREAGMAGEAALADGTPPLIGVPVKGSFLGDKSADWAEAVIRHIEKKNITRVMLIARWSYYEEKDPVRLEAALHETIRRLDEIGCKVLILLCTPDLNASAPQMLVRKYRTGEDNLTFRQTGEEHLRKNTIIYRLSGQRLPSLFVDPAPLLMEADTGRYRAALDGVALYYDNTHLTVRGARHVLLPLFREVMPAWLGDSRQ